MRKLEIRLLGTLSVAAEQAGEFTLTRKNKAVLAALALAGPKGLSRDKLVDFFWRNRGEKEARASLRQALAATRKGLGPYRDCLQADAHKITIDGAKIKVDAPTFEALASSEADEDRGRALALYQGDLLDGVPLKEEGFEA
jgi:DNA-binding SARP family transcriptional activator